MRPYPHSVIFTARKEATECAEDRGAGNVAMGAHIELVVSFTCIRRNGAIGIGVEVGQVPKFLEKNKK